MLRCTQIINKGELIEKEKLFQKLKLIYIPGARKLRARQPKQSKVDFIIPSFYLLAICRCLREFLTFNYSLGLFWKYEKNTIMALSIYL